MKKTTNQDNQANPTANPTAETSATQSTAIPVENPVEQPVETPVEQPAPDASDVLTAQITELTNDLQRTRADFENYRKQVEAQRLQAMSSSRQMTVEKFLPLVDDFLRALEAYPEQLAPLSKSFTKTLQTLGLSQIDSKVGTEFNPDLHEAVSVEDGDGETEVIAETLRPGYLYDGSVIRAAMVKVKRQ